MKLFKINGYNDVINCNCKKIIDREVGHNIGNPPIYFSIIGKFMISKNIFYPVEYMELIHEID